MKEKKKGSNIKIKTGIMLAVIFIAGIYTGAIIFSKTGVDTADSVLAGEVSMIEKDVLYLESPTSVKINLPAVNANNTGVTAFLEVDVRPGTGLVLVNVGNIISNYDTQESMRSAAEIASEYTYKSLDNVDIIYNLVANASILEGPSAGAAFAVATVFALEDEEIRDDVMMTGTINHDFSIGPAGRVRAKAVAAKESGSELFLVPAGESYEYNESEYCSDYGLFEGYCQIEYRPVKIEDIAEIKVIEVETLGDAVALFRA